MLYMAVTRQNGRLVLLLAFGVRLCTAVNLTRALFLLGFLLGLLLLVHLFMTFSSILPSEMSPRHSPVGTSQETPVERHRRRL